MKEKGKQSRRKRNRTEEKLGKCPSDSSVHGIFQARILEWVAISYSWGSFPTRNWTRVSSVSSSGRQILYHCSTWEAPLPCFLVCEVLGGRGRALSPTVRRKESFLRPVPFPLDPGLHTPADSLHLWICLRFPVSFALYPSLQFLNCGILHSPGLQDHSGWFASALPPLSGTENCNTVTSLAWEAPEGQNHKPMGGRLSRSPRCKSQSGQGLGLTL